MEIPLTQGKVAQIDPEDWPLVNRYKWHAARYCEGGKSWWYARTKIGGQLVRMHNLLTEDNHVDHWDGDGLNNRRGNLRPCSQPQNLANSGSRGGSSVLKGVSWNREKGRWKVAFRWSGQFHFVGYFDDEVAARAYDAAIVPLANEFARLNFPLAA